MKDSDISHIIHRGAATGEDGGICPPPPPTLKSRGTSYVLVPPYIQNRSIASYHTHVNVV